MGWDGGRVGGDRKKGERGRFPYTLFGVGFTALIEGLEGVYMLKGSGLIGGDWESEYGSSDREGGDARTAWDQNKWLLCDQVGMIWYLGNLSYVRKVSDDVAA